MKTIKIHKKETLLLFIQANLFEKINEKHQANKCINQLLLFNFQTNNILFYSILTIIINMIWFFFWRAKNKRRQADLQQIIRSYQITTENLLLKTSIVEKFRQAGRKTSVSSNSENQALLAEDWIQLQEIIDNSFENFTQRLKVHTPKITLNEIQLCLLIKVQLSTFEISNILRTSEANIRTKRSRLKIKLNVDKKKLSLTHFLIHF